MVRELDAVAGGRRQAAGARTRARCRTFFRRSANASVEISLVLYMLKGSGRGQRGGGEREREAGERAVAAAGAPTHRSSDFSRSLSSFFWREWAFWHCRDGIGRRRRRARGHEVSRDRRETEARLRG